MQRTNTHSHARRAKYYIKFLESEGPTNPLPADAATIPADARGTFHLPPAANNHAPPKLARGVRHRGLGDSRGSAINNTVLGDTVSIPADARSAFHLPPAAHFTCSRQLGNLATSSGMPNGSKVETAKHFLPR